MGLGLRSVDQIGSRLMLVPVEVIITQGAAPESRKEGRKTRAPLIPAGRRRDSPGHGKKNEKRPGHYFGLAGTSASTPGSNLVLV